MRRNLVRAGWFGFGLIVVMLSAAAPANAGAYPVAAAPEIDASAIPAALGILGAGALMLRARRAK